MKKERAQEIVSQFSGKKVLVVGDVVIDHYVYGKVERLNPEAPVPILEAKREEEMTGGAGNTAKNLAMLGADTVLVGISGDDAGCDRLRDLAHGEGYRAECVRDGSRPTIRKVRHIVGSQQLLRVDYEEVHNISPEIEEKVVAAITKEIEEDGIQAILVSDYAKGTITEGVAKAILKLGKTHNIIVAADIKPSRAPFFVGATFISPNRKEAHEILGFNQHEQGGRPAPELARALRDKMKCDVYLTLSADGMYVLAGDGTEVHVPQEHVVEVFDPSGAGDTAAAAITLARLAGATPPETAEIGNAAGAVVVQKVGSVGLSADELLSMMTHHHDTPHD